MVAVVAVVVRRRLLGSVVGIHPSREAPDNRPTLWRRRFFVLNLRCCVVAVRRLADGCAGWRKTASFE